MKFIYKKIWEYVCVDIYIYINIVDKKNTKSKKKQTSSLIPPLNPLMNVVWRSPLWSSPHLASKNLHLQFQFATKASDETNQFPCQDHENPLKINGWTPQTSFQVSFGSPWFPICPFPGDGNRIHPSHAVHAHAPFDSLSPVKPGSDVAKKGLETVKHP